LFFPQLPQATDGRAQSCRIDDRAYFNIRQKSAPGCPVSGRAVLDLPQHVVNTIGLYSSSGAEAGRVVYSDYRPAQGTSIVTGMVYPRRITLHVPGGEYWLDVDVDDITLNSPIAASRFIFPPPPGYKRQSLTEALAAKLAIWD
jgi:hypothetical protein